MLSNDLSNEQLRFVCYRVADIPTPQVLSHQRPCADCDAPIGTGEIAFRTAQNLYSLHRSRCFHETDRVTDAT